MFAALALVILFARPRLLRLASAEAELGARLKYESALRESEQRLQVITDNVPALVGYFLVALAVTAARVALLAVIAFGLVATGVAVLVGPIFIPFFLVPQLDWLFWGWLKAFIQYSFIPVVAIAFLMIFERFVYRYVTTLPPTSSGSWTCVHDWASFHMKRPIAKCCP